MIARLLLRLPWFLSVPSLVVMAVVMAAGLNLVAGTYFQRTFRDDADPLAGLSAPAARVAAPAQGGVASPAAPAPAPVGAAATQAAATAQAAPAMPAAAQGAVAAAPAAPAAPATPASGVLAQGQFVDGDPGHNGKGRARLIRGPDGALTLRFEDFSVTNGPDLFVILSTDPKGSRASAAAADALDLGRLRATTGNVNHAVPDGADTAKYHSVIIYCRAFKVVFAVATLE